MSQAPDALQLAKALHAEYCRLTGFDLIYNIQRENLWRAWMSYGSWQWTVQDLAAVIFYLKKKIARGDRNDGALRFQNLVGQPDKFEEDLAFAKKELRTPYGGRPQRTTPRPAQAEAQEEAPQDPAEAAARWRAMMKGGDE